MGSACGYPVSPVWIQADPHDARHALAAGGRGCPKSCARRSSLRFRLRFRPRIPQVAAGGSSVDFRARSIGSVKKHELLEAGVRARRLAGGLLSVEARARCRNDPEEDFRALGAKSSKDRGTTFRLEDINCTATFGVRPSRWLEIDATGTC